MQSNQYLYYVPKYFKLSKSCLFTFTLSIFFDIVMISSIFFISDMNKIKIGIDFFVS